MLWFPCFFAAGFAVLGLQAFAHPAPHGIEVGLVAPAEQSDFPELPAGIDLIGVEDPVQARALVASGALAAATDGAELLLASAASSTRAGYLEDLFAETSPQPLTVVDVNPLPQGDASGTGLFFYALPNLLVGLIVSIVLLQAGPWPIGKKAAVILAAGLFSAVFSFAVAASLHAIPPDLRLLGYALLLTQTIGWLTTAAALYARRLFMPLAMTFVLILGIPSSGATVNADMLPSGVRWIGRWHPFAQFISLVRADVYLDASSGRPLAILLSWAALGAVLLILRALREKRSVLGISVHARPVGI
ncbi:hypothetical protein GCM10022383_16500 [Microbacterium soli]|uniref:ABC transporter permease n=1 Tax=Microbacterium soli TaxID=446075 RepID=A0ABP7N9C3_9MICO